MRAVGLYTTAAPTASPSSANRELTAHHAAAAARAVMNVSGTARSRNPPYGSANAGYVPIAKAIAAAHAWRADRGRRAIANTSAQVTVAAMTSRRRTVRSLAPNAAKPAA